MNPKQKYADWEFQTYMGSTLTYDKLCEPKTSDNEKKEGDNITGNRLINKKNDNQQRDFFVC